MEPNQNPPCEREWTIQEREEFFASQDAVTGLFPNSVANNVLMPNFIQEIEHIFDPGIHITSIVPPEQGWPIAAHCCHCRKTVIILSPWAKKPDKGDYFLLKGTCLDEEEHIKHNMYPQTWYPWRKEKIEFKPLDPLPQDNMQAYLLKYHVFGPYDAEITQEMSIDEAKKRWQNTPEGE
jgi:hypothetical protein